MAEHDGAAEETESVAAPELVDETSAEDIDAEDFDAEDFDAEDFDAEDIDAEDIDAEDDAGNDTKTRVPKWVSSIPRPIAVGLAIIVALSGLGGWLGFRVHQDNQV